MKRRQIVTNLLPEDNKHTIVATASSIPTTVNVYDEIRLQEIAISYAVIDQIPTTVLNLHIAE